MVYLIIDILVSNMTDSDDVVRCDSVDNENPQTPDDCPDDPMAELFPTGIHPTLFTYSPPVV